MALASPLDARSDLCIDHGSRLAALEEARRRQNGSLEKLVDAMHSQGERLAGMDEKLSTLIARQAEDRAAVEKLRNVHDSGPHVDPGLTMAKPPEQQLDAAAKVLGLPLWKALLYALLVGGALAGGGKGASSVIDLLKPSPSVTAPTTGGGR